MIKYLLTFLWNSKRHFAGIFIEQMLVFIVLMICLVSLFDMLEKYYEPGLPDTENVVSLGYMAERSLEMSKREELNRSLDAILENMRQWEHVEGISESVSLVPYFREPEYYLADSVTISGRKYHVHMKLADISAERVFKIELLEGEWLHTLPDGSWPAVITRQLADEVNAGKSLIGTRIYDNRNFPYTVVGIAAGIKEDVFTPAAPAVILPYQKNEASLFRIYREICARIEPGHAEEFCNRSYRECKRLLPYFSEIDFGAKDMGVYKEQAMFSVTSRLKLITIPTLFLVIFAFIGTLGLLVLNTKKRIQEFSLHRALGATKSALLRLVIFQGLTLTLSAAVPGILLSLIVFSFSFTHLLALAAALGCMLLFSLFSACYPAWQIAQTNPAEILHQE